MGQFFESLERRQLFSVTLKLHLLKVTGATSTGNQIEIVRPRGANYLRVNLNGTYMRPAISDVHRIEVYGGSENDEISVSYGNWDPKLLPLYVDGGAGDDTINGYLGADTLLGGDGNDSINAGAGNDNLDGGTGNDTLIGGAGKDHITGGAGDDLMDGVAGVDTVSGGKGLDRLTQLPSPGNAVKMVYSAKYNLLFMLNSGSAIKVVDLATGTTINTRLASNTFTDIDLSPSGDYLFAADFGGEDTGYGTPSSTSRVQRYNLAKRSWEGPKDCPGVVYKIEAVDDKRFVTLSSDQWTTIQLLRFDSTQVTQLSTISGDYYGDIEYDPATGRIFQGNSGSSSAEVHVYRVQGDTLTTAEATPVYGPLGEYGGGLTTLSTDGSALYYGDAKLESLDVNNIEKTFPEPIIAASASFAVSSSTVYDAGHANVRMPLGIKDAVIAMSPAGDSFWAYSQAKQALFQFG